MSVLKEATGEKITPARPRRANSRFGCALIGLLLLIVLLASMAVIFHRSLLRAYAPGVLDSIATDYRDNFDIGFEWAGYGVTGISDFTINGVSVTDLPTGRALLTCDSVRIRTNLIALYLRRADPMQGVTSVELARPVVTLGREAGRWNTGKLLEPSLRKKNKLPGQFGLTIRDGAVHWLGGEVTDGVSVPPLELAGLQGNYRSEADGKLNVNVNGTMVGSEIEPATLTVKGVFDPSTALMHMTSTINGLDLKLAEDYVEEYEFRNLRGLADAELSILIGPSAGQAGWSMLGDATIRDCSTHYDGYNLDAVDIAGEVQFSHRSVFTSGLSALVEGSPVTFRGRIGDFGNESYNIIADAKNVTRPLIDRILPSLKDIPAEGPLDAHVEMEGVPDNWKVLVQANSPSMASYGIPYGLKDLLVWYSDDIVTVRRVEAEVGGGNASAEGVVDLRGEEASWRFHATASGVQSEPVVAMLPGGITGGLSPTGTLSADITVASHGGASPTLTGVVESPDMRFGGLAALPPLSVTVPFEVAQEKIQVHGATAEGAGLSILADGQYASGTSATANIALTVDDPALIGGVTKLPIAARLAVAGDVGYSKRAGFTFSGDGMLNDVRVGEATASGLSAKVSYGDGIVHVSDIGGLVAGAEIDGDVAIPLTARAESATGTLELKGLNISPLLPKPYASVISTSLDIKGGISFKPGDGNEGGVQVGLLVSESGARVGPNLVTTNGDGISVEFILAPDFSGIKEIVAGGSVSSQVSAVRIREGRVLTPYAERVLDGITDLLTGQNRPVESSPSLIVPAVSGLFTLTADVLEPLGATRGDLDIAGDDLAFEGYQISHGSLQVESTEGDRWRVLLAGDSDSAGSFEISGEVDRGPTLRDSTLALVASVRDSGLSRIFDFLGLSKYGQFSGSMSGSGSIGGTLGTPVVSDFQINLSQSKAFGIPLTGGKLTFGYQPPVLNLSQLDIEGENGLHVMGAGSIDTTAPSLTGASLVLKLDRFDLGYVSRFMSSGLPIEGEISGTVQLARDALGTKVLYSATVDQAAVTVGGESIVLGNIALDALSRPGKPEIIINSFELSSGEQEVSVSGRLPMSLEKFDPGIIDISVTSETGYAPPIPAGLIASGVSWEGGLGPVHLTLKGISLAGDFALDVGNVRLGQITLLNAVRGVFHAANSVITASPDEVRMVGQGWELGVDGHADLLKMLVGLPGSVRLAVTKTTEGPLRLTGPGYDLELEPGTGDDAPALGVEGHLPRLVGTITGKLTVVGGDIDIADFPANLFAASENGFNLLKFDFKTELQGALKVKSGDSFNWVFERGSLALTGPATMPVLTGTLVAPTGWMDIMGNHFVLTEPLEMVFSSVYEFTDPHITAVAQATLREVRSPENFGEQLVITAGIDSLRSTMLDNMQLTSQPPRSRDELIAALAYEDIVFRTLGGSIFGESFGAPGLRDVGFEALALPIATSYLSRYIRRESWFSDFEVSIDTEQRLYIYVEKDILDDFVMYYRQTFGADIESYVWGSRYMFRSRSWVGLEIDNNEDVTGQVQYIVPLD